MKLVFSVCEYDKLPITPLKIRIFFRNYGLLKDQILNIQNIIRISIEFRKMSNKRYLLLLFR